MQEKAEEEFAGGSVAPWYAPNITSDANSGIGSWNQDDLVQYLSTGDAHRKAQAAGSMGEAVERELQRRWHSS
jgi:hypothetical protein